MGSGAQTQASRFVWQPEISLWSLIFIANCQNGMEEVDFVFAPIFLSVGLLQAVEATDG